MDLDTMYKTSKYPTIHGLKIHLNVLRNVQEYNIVHSTKFRRIYDQPEEIYEFKP